MNAKTKKILTCAGALALTAAISITGTVAYLTKLTEQRANNFTFETEGLDAMLTEPEWDGVVGYEYTDDGKSIIPVFGYTSEGKSIYGYTKDDDTETPITESDSSELTGKTVEQLRPTKNEKGETIEYGDTEAQKMVPGTSAAKNPIITNTGTMEEWVAAKITFVYGEGAFEDTNGNGKKDTGEADRAGKPLSATDMAKVTKAIDIDYDADNAEKVAANKWVRPSGVTEVDSAEDVSQVFYYNTSLAAKEKTDSIFSTVTVKDDATTEDVKALEDIGGFAIWIEGYAVQKSEFGSGTEWVAAAGTAKDAVFENTPSDKDPAPVAQPGIIGSNGETAAIKGNNSKS